MSLRVCILSPAFTVNAERMASKGQKRIMQGWPEAERRLARWGTTPAHTLLTTQPAASTVLFPLLWLSHVGSCILCKDVQCGPANVCFLFLNSVASSHFKRGVNFTIRFMVHSIRDSGVAMPHCICTYHTWHIYDKIQRKVGRAGSFGGKVASPQVPFPCTLFPVLCRKGN